MDYTTLYYWGSVFFSGIYFSLADAYIVGIFICNNDRPAAEETAYKAAYSQTCQCSDPDVAGSGGPYHSWLAGDILGYCQCTQLEWISGSVGKGVGFCGAFHMSVDREDIWSGYFSCGGKYGTDQWGPVG